MDIEEAKKFARNKIEADTLTQQVRDVIKITKWQKQDMREGFKETFKPLIKSQDSIKKSIDEQQNATIAQLKKNQLALTQGFEQFNRLADMRELPYPEDLGDYDNQEGWDLNWAPTSIYDTRLNLEKNFDGRDLELLKEFGLPRPNDFFEIQPKVLDETLEELKDNIKQLTGEISGRNKAKNPSPLYEAETEIKKQEKGLLMKYKNTMKVKDYLSSLKYKVGQGIVYFNNPHQLLNRLELLGGSILAGNNGVIPEFSQIAHLLNQMKVITKKQLNDLLKNYLIIR